MKARRPPPKVKPHRVLPLVTLGESFSLNGTVPRGADLEQVSTVRCRQCNALVIRPGYRYCETCRAARCTYCQGKDGQHGPKCKRATKRCKGCGGEIWRANATYCEACRAAACPECRRMGGAHQTHCLYDQRTRRPGLTEVHHLVGKRAIRELYEAHRVRAIRLAWRIVRHEAEDVVQDVALYLLEKRDYLTRAPGPAYFFTAVSRMAKRRHLYAWAKYVVPMDPGDVVLAEQAMYERHNGQVMVP